jgi:hypothetical protein
MVRMGERVSERGRDVLHGTACAGNVQFGMGHGLHFRRMADEYVSHSSTDLTSPIQKLSSSGNMCENS